MRFGPLLCVIVALGAGTACAQEEKIAWGNEVNGLVVAIAPMAKEPGKFTIRCKNVAKETLELQWVGFGSNATFKHLDDLLRDADDKLVPLRVYKFPTIGGPPDRPRTVILTPEKVHTETIDLWTYVKRPAADGKFQLSIELEIKIGQAPQKGAKYWTGKIESNLVGYKFDAADHKVVVAEKPAAKPDPELVKKLVEQLKSSDFKTRDLATKELSKLEEVPDALRELVKSGDLESKRRAEAIVAAIIARAEEKAFEAMAADLHKIELDRFVRHMIRKDDFAGDKEWTVIKAVAKAVTKRANELAGRKYEVPDFDMKSLPIAYLAAEHFGFQRERILLDHLDYRAHRISSIDRSVVLCTGMLRLPSLTNSIVIVDGDVADTTGMDNCLLIASGKVRRFTRVTKSIILASGDFKDAARCEQSFIQVKNQVWLTGSRDGKTSSRVLDTDKGPLQLLKFSP